MGVGRSARSVAFCLAFLALLTGAMADSLDTDLVGIVVAAVCIAILLIVLFSFLTYCCFRGVEFDRDSVIRRRKDSGSVSTANGPPRWTAPSGSMPTSPTQGPLYNVATDPVMYAMPTSLAAAGFAGTGAGHFLRQHPHHSSSNNNFRDSDRMKQIRQAQEREEFRLQETAYAQPTTTSQPNGHVVQDLPSSGVNYRVARKQETSENKGSRWSEKKYVETEKTMEIQEEDDDDDVVAVGKEGAASKPSLAMDASKGRVSASPQKHPQPQPQHQHQPQPKPQPLPQAQRPRSQVIAHGGGTGQWGVRAEVSPKHSNLDSRDVLHVSEEFTIVDFVVDSQQQQQQRQQQRQRRRGEDEPTYSYRAYVDRDYNRPTEITCYSSAPKRGRSSHLADTSHGSSGSGFVPPVSTSTPRSPGSDHEGQARDGEEENEEDRPRMRKPKEGSVRILPEAQEYRYFAHPHQSPSSSPQQHRQKRHQNSGGYKGDFML